MNLYIYTHPYLYIYIYIYVCIYIYICIMYLYIGPTLVRREEELHAQAPLPPPHTLKEQVLVSV